MTAPLLETDHVTKRFGPFIAVDAVSLRAEAGEILGLLGPNGAGKTTLLKMIRGLLRPTSGLIRIGGLDLALRPEAARSLGYMSQKFSLYSLLTGFENIELFGGISDLGSRGVRRKKEEVRAKVPEEILRRKTKDIPPGFRQAIALFACLMTDPAIILLDEPTTGVGPDIRRSFWREIDDLKKAGRTILVTTHDLREAEHADRIFIIDRGRIVLEGRPDDLLRQPDGRTMDNIYQEAVGHAPRN
jgi:ABC-2 type transport system ATP-binding protein